MDLKEAPILNKIKRHPWEYARADFVLFLVRRLLAHRPHARMVLDVGCGDAFLTDHLAKRLPKLKFIGIDCAFSESDIRTLGNSSPANVVLYDSLSRVKESADIILLLDVLEHVAGEADLLRDIARPDIAHPKTLFLVTVPARQELFSRHDFFLGHYRRYDLNSLENIFNEAGMVKAMSGYFFSSLFLWRRFFNFQTSEEGSGVNLSRTTATAAWKGGRLISKLLAKILLADAKLGFYLKHYFNFQLPGLSLYMVGKKKSHSQK
jgi:SAM-dependent methyltransferase